MQTSTYAQDTQLQVRAIKRKGIPAMQMWLVQLITLTILTTHLCANVYANSHELLDEVAFLQGNNEPATDDSASQLMDEVKRSWQSLQGSWGKRDQNGVATASDDYDNQISEWNPTNSNEFEHPEMSRYLVIYATSPNALGAAVDAAASSVPNKGETVEADTQSNFEKRNWKNMNVAWGKRRSAVWNKFRGAWGKREPGWNNLKGMWGKRSPGDWNKLQSAWGKRYLQQ